MARWEKACRADAVREGEPVGVTLGGLSIGIFRVGDRLRAVHDICSHEYALLSGGYQEDGAVECPLHQARFDLATGKCLAAPAERDLTVFAVKVEEGEVYVEVPEGASDEGLTRGA